MKTNKKLKSAIKKIAVLVLGVCLFAGCNMIPEDDGTTPPPLFPQPRSVEANPEGGYAVNPVTGDSIRPLINSLGDTVVTGIPISVIGKVFHLDSVAQPKSLKVPPQTKFTFKKAHPNRFKVPENLTNIPVDHSQLETIKEGEGNQDFVLLSSTGDTTSTGVLITIKSKKINAKHSRSTPALPPPFKDAALTNLKYLDVDQGMISSLVYSILEDKNGYIWMGTYRGISKYDGQSFINYTEKEGFINSAVRAIIEDKRGHIWFGTNGGVIVFDGQSFYHFSGIEGTSFVIIRSIFEDSNGHIWVGTDGKGVSKLIPSNTEGYKSASIIHFTEKEGLRSNFISSIIEDQNGLIWIGSNDGLTAYDGQSFTHFTEKDGLSSNRITSIFEDKNGHLWIGTLGGGVNKYDGKTFTHFTQNESLSQNVIWSFLEDSNGHLWFGTSGGVTVYDGQYLTHFTETEGLSNNSVMSIYEDTNKNLWFGTNGGGVSVFNRQSFKNFNENIGLSNNRVLSINEDKNKNLWFGTVRGGITMYNGEGFTYFTEKEGLSNNIVTSILEDKYSNLWFGTWEGGLNKYDGETITYFTTEQGLSSNSITSLLEDKKGNIWIGVRGGGVNKFDGKTFTQFTQSEGMSHHSVLSILEDTKGNLWFSTWGGGVSKYDGESFIHFTQKEGLSHNSVMAMSEDNQGNLWFVTGGGGVNKYDGLTFSHFTEKEGLSDNLTWSSLIDKQDRVWIGTGNGMNLQRVSPNTNQIENKSTIIIFNKKDGLKSLNFLNNSSYLDSENRAWWGSDNGLVMLDLNNYSVSEKIPQPTLTQLEINEQFIDYRNLSDSIREEIRFSEVQQFENYPLDLSIPYHKNHLTFHFVAIDWAAPHKIQYSYRLLGLDERWSNPTSEAKTDYRNLSFGTYTFQVRAIGESGEWSDPFEYTFTIRPPWWHTWWAYIGYILLILLVLRIFSKWRERKLEEEKEQLQQKVEERTRQLKDSLDNLKSIQDQLIQQEKLASLGQLTAGIAHEIKNPLNFVNNFSDVSIEMIDEAIDEVRAQGLAPQPQEDILEILSDIKSNLQKIHEHGSRANGIVSSMLQHSRGGTGKKEPTDLNTLIKEYVNLSFHGMRASKNPINVEIQLDLDESIGRVDLIGEDFSRVILNLCNNAFDAMRAVSKERLAVLKVRSKRQHNNITIEIEDNGPGIPDEIKDKILQPFFTTKKGTEGTGLGLSISHDIVKAHGGIMEVESTVNEGTLFKIILNKQ